MDGYYFTRADTFKTVIGSTVQNVTTGQNVARLQARWVAQLTGTAPLPVPAALAWPAPPQFITSAFLNTAIRDTVRRITNSDGQKVYTAVEGLPLIKAGKEVKYSGASGPCTFTDIGDITDCKFRYNRVDNGTFKFIEVG